MTCTQCGHDMTPSASGWLCFSCGHMESESGAPGVGAPNAQPQPVAQAVMQPAAPAAPLPPLAAPLPPQPGITASVAPTFAAAPAVVSVGGNLASPMAIPSETMPPAVWHRHSRAKIAALVIGVIAVTTLIGGTAYQFAVAPNYALAGYLGRVASAKTMTFSATTSIDSGTDYRFSLKLAGKDDVTDLTKPKLDVSVTGQTALSAGVALPGAAAASGSLSAEFRLLSQVAYFKIDSFSLLTQLLPIKISNDWYKYDLAASGDTTLTTNKCFSGKKDSGSVLGNSILTNIPVKHASLRGIDTINGVRMMHYVGTIDNAKLKQAIDTANKKLSADCKLDVSADDFKNVTMSYELWRGVSTDRISVDIVESTSKAHVVLTMDTGAYNQPVTIAAPSGAKDVSELLTSLGLGGLDSSTGTDTGSGTTTDTATVTQKANDTKRRTDLRTLQQGLEEYFVNTNAYPSSLADLTIAQNGSPAIIKKLPTDPINKGGYTYVYTPGTIDVSNGALATYTLHACLEDAASTSDNVIAPVPPCTTATFELVNNN